MTKAARPSKSRRSPSRRSPRSRRKSAPRIKRHYGGKPDLPDPRDRMYAAARRAPKLPPLVDLRNHCPPVYRQGKLNCCTGNAIAAAIEFDQRRQGTREFRPSRLFVYYNERVAEGTVDQDAGARIRHGIKAVARFGAPPESVWPYDIGKFAHRPHIVVHNASGDRFERGLARKAGHFDKSKSVIGETRLPDLSPLPFQCVYVGNLRPSQVRHVQRTVRIERFRMA